MDELDRATLAGQFDISLPTAGRISVKRPVTMEEHVTVAPDCHLMARSIGSYTYLGNDCKLYNVDSIGRYCSFGESILIGAGPHPSDWLSTSTFFFRKNRWANHPDVAEFYEAQKLVYKAVDKGVSIGNDVWMGSRAIVLSEVTIGHGAIIGAGAVVTKDVAPYAVVAGVPARTLRYRFEESTINRLLKSEWWTVNPLRIKGMNYADVHAMLEAIEEIKQGLDWLYTPKTVIVPAT